MKQLTKTLGWLALWWLWMPVLFALGWVIFHGLFGGFGVANESWNLYWQTSVLNHAPVLWFYFVVGGIGTAIITFMASDSDKDTVGEWALVVAGAVIAIGAFVPFFNLNWDSDKDVGRFYNSATTFYTPSLSNPPTSLQYLLRSSNKEDNGCTVNTASDVPNCVRVGTFSDKGYEARTSSQAGAILAMQRTSGATQNVDLLSDTLTYIQGRNAWSAIRDGSGNNAHTEGVVEWTGDGNPTECYFGGNDQFNKAIYGAHTNSLSNVLAKAYPTVFWTIGDVYGYCQNNRPVLIFMVQQQRHYLSQTVTVPAGVVKITGSASGDPHFTYEANPSDLPGPSYPYSINDSQITANTWAAGRSNKDHGLFGYERDSHGDGDYLLKSLTDGHQYFVTPLTLTSSSSELFLAYAVVRADEVHAGQLNPMSIYVLGTNDPRRVNIDSLEASARNYLSQQVPGFFSSGGSLVDYTPLNGDVWRTFGEINGRVVYRLDISASNAIQPNLVALENFTGTGKSKAPSNAVCGQPLSGMTQPQIELCIRLFANSLGTATAP